jgi:glycosyltransferase involved in cell wall biosynthesis
MDVLERRHAERPYDLIYQYSQIELGALRRLQALAPVVLHPQVHAMGELRWTRREADLARRCEPLPRRGAVVSMLALRSLAQHRDIRLARGVITASRYFAEDLARDYGVPRERFKVVPNPIDLRRFHPRDSVPAERPLTALFVTRLSVRKGVEMIVKLSHRLADLKDDLRLVVVGDKTLWSDYRPLLRDLNPAVATYHGPGEREVPRLYREADLVLQPSHYEPFALTVAEALASGCPVVVSNAVGAAEQVDPRCCRVFPRGHMDAFEAEVRELVGDLLGGAGDELRAVARSEAERRFDPLAVGGRLAGALESLAAGA